MFTNDDGDESHLFCNLTYSKAASFEQSDTSVIIKMI